MRLRSGISGFRAAEKGCRTALRVLLLARANGTCPEARYQVNLNLTWIWVRSRRHCRLCMLGQVASVAGRCSMIS